MAKAKIMTMGMVMIRTMMTLLMKIQTNKPKLIPHADKRIKATVMTYMAKAMIMTMRMVMITTMMTMSMKIQTNKPELIAPAEIRGKASPLFKVVKSPELGKKEISHKSDKFCAQC